MVADGTPIYRPFITVRPLPQPKRSTPLWGGVCSGKAMQIDICDASPLMHSAIADRILCGSRWILTSCERSSSYLRERLSLSRSRQCLHPLRWIWFWHMPRRLVEWWKMPEGVNRYTKSRLNGCSHVFALRMGGYHLRRGTR